MRSSSCEFDRHINMLSSSCESEVEFDRHVMLWVRQTHRHAISCYHLAMWRAKRSENSRTFRLGRIGHENVDKNRRYLQKQFFGGTTIRVDFRALTCPNQCFCCYRLSSSYIYVFVRLFYPRPESATFFLPATLSSCEFDMSQGLQACPL
jgi:hypothetical protein